MRQKTKGLSEISTSETMENAQTNLTSQQETALQALVGGKTIVAAAEDAGVARGTVHRWLRDDFAFQAAINGARQTLRRSSAIALESLADKAVEVVRGALEKDADPRTAIALLKGLGLLEATPRVLGSDDAEILKQEAELASESKKTQLAQQAHDNVMTRMLSPFGR